jgi:hypothetical protein
MRNFILAFVLIVGLITITGCTQKKVSISDSAPESPTNKELPLSVDDEPLLLEDNPVELSADTMPVNSRCIVCHMNYTKEDIAITHARVNIGCAHCHGESDAHIDDESWSWGGKGTPPDIMFTPEKINPFCMECHPEDEINAERHRDVLAGEDPDFKTCTDCHGDHRLSRRQVKWEKTEKVI